MRLSIALASYNGNLFLNEQIRSIINQSVLPEELIVSDDYSSDKTNDCLAGWETRCPFDYHILRQSRNVGVVSNFSTAISACKGDVIVLADQDDAWHPHKLSRIRDAFARDASVGLVFSDADLVDQDLKPLGRTLWQSIGFNEAERAQIRTPWGFDLLLRRFLVTGATLAFRRSLLELVLPISKHLIHDAWIAIAAAAVSKIECIEEPLIQYRQHPNQQIGERGQWNNWRSQWQAAKSIPPNYFQKQKLFFSDLADHLNRFSSHWVHAKVGKLASQKVQHLERRIAFREKKGCSYGGIAKEYLTGEYSRFSYGWKSAVQDVFS